MVVAPEATKIDSQGRVTAMTPETQMQIVQAINRVLNPASALRQPADNSQWQYSSDKYPNQAAAAR